MSDHEPSVDTERDEKGQTALHQAVEAGREHDARASIERGASLTARRMDGRAVLHLACKAGMIWLVERALAAGTEVDDAQNWDREAPLQVAVAADHVDVARFLLARGADARLPDKSGRTALFSAKTAAMAELLIAAGARPEHLDHEKSTALHVAARWNRVEVIEVLVRHGAKVGAPNERGRSPLGEAASDSAVAALSTLIRLGAEVDHASINGTALYWAAWHGELQAMRVLLDHGADPNARNAHAGGRAPLHEAAAWGQVEAIALLLQRGADPSLITADGKKPLAFASTAAARAAFPQDPATVARARDGGRIVEELEWLGFFRYVARSKLQAVKALVVDSYVSERTLTALAHEKRSWWSQHRREIDTDAEDLAEGGIAGALRAIDVVLAEHGLTLDEARDDFGPDGYTVVVNGRSWVVHGKANGERFGWGAAYRRFIEIGNEILEAAGLPERLYAMGYKGNDARVLLLTPELHDYVLGLDLDDDWKPRPSSDVGWP